MLQQRDESLKRVPSALELCSRSVRVLFIANVESKICKLTNSNEIANKNNLCLRLSKRNNFMKFEKPLSELPIINLYAQV